LAVKIETLLYRRSPDMSWYGDRRILEWRIVQIMKEFTVGRRTVVSTGGDGLR
jgi:hypothetical protein